MTTLQQQIDFVHDMRESFDTQQREAILATRTPEAIAELLRDIEENLLAVRMMQASNKADLCTDCKQPLNAEGYTINGIKVCIRCTQKRFDLAAELNHARHESAPSKR